jgi:2-succinyl-5-enolpyruvyl-6-hydroxy-3-cyclohexene-1-carboxylate synthase
MKANVVQSLWSRIMMGTLRGAGVRHAVVSPGSRSTPFLAALLDESEFRIHRVIDERSAAFVGLGLARASRQPVLLLCTSGTASANYFPAIIEADQSNIPLVVLTADRPVEAQFANSPQTTDQVQLYGAHVRRYVELGEAHGNVPALRAFQRLILSGLHLAQFPIPGPVHFNARARKPLEPAAPDSPEAQALETQVNELLRRQPALPPLAPFSVHLRALREFAEGSSSPRGLIVCGYDPQWPELDADALAEFSSVTGYPVWIDVAHPLRWNLTPRLAARTLGCANLIWGGPNCTAEFTPDVLVQVGSIPTSSHFESWLERVGAKRHFLLARQGWPDPTGRAERVLMGDPSLTLRNAAGLVRGDVRGERSQSSWFLSCKRVNGLASAALERFIQSETGTSELRAVRTVLEACPAGTRVALGNSLPIRDADLVWPAAELAQYSFAIRGTNGIDGVVSTAVGVALDGHAPVLLLLGDISFLHDIGGLYAARDVESPLAIVVLDNQGGRIFEQLPIAASVDAPKLEHWTTPHSLNLEAAAGVYGIEVKSPTSGEALGNDIRVALMTNKTTLICVHVDQASAKNGESTLTAAVSGALKSASTDG